MMDSFSKMVLRSDSDSRFETGDCGYSSIESVDNRIVCLMRIMLAVSALVVIFIDPISPHRFSELTDAVLISYCLYSIFLYFWARRAILLVLTDIAIWVDVTWYLVLIALSNGTNSIFFFFFFFSVLIAAYRSGFKAGLRVTIVSTLLFSIIGYATVSSGLEFELNRFLTRSIALLMLGYMISYWGGREIKFKRHLILLKDANHLSNPRFGVNRTLIPFSIRNCALAIALVRTRSSSDLVTFTHPLLD